jgi:hypothetical protein
MTSEELQALIASNAKSIQALTDRIAQTDAISRRHSDEIVTLSEMVARFSLEAAADRREMRRSIESVESSIAKIEQLIERRFGGVDQ